MRPTRHNTTYMAYNGQAFPVTKMSLYHTSYLLLLRPWFGNGSLVGLPQARPLLSLPKAPLSPPPHQKNSSCVCHWHLLQGVFPDGPQSPEYRDHAFIEIYLGFVQRGQ